MSLKDKVFTEVREATKDDLSGAISLSKKHCYNNVKHREEGFTLKPITSNYAGNVYVAEVDNKIVGTACVRKFSEKDFGYYEVDKSEKAMEIEKVTVDENYRGLGIGSAIIKFILKKFPGTKLCTSILEDPVENKNSKRLFKKNGFICRKFKECYHKDLDLREKSGCYINKNKFNFSEPAIHIGTQNINTERLTLRRFKIGDAPYVFKNWASDPDNVAALTWNAHPSVSLTESIVASWVNDYSDKTNYRWCITLKGTDIPVGGINVTNIIDDSTCEIGFVLSKSLWNKGIMTEAARAVINYLFINTSFNKVTAYHNIDNPASGRVLLKVGMHQMFVIPKGAKKNTGEMVDKVVYEISKS